MDQKRLDRTRGHALLTAELRAALPKLYSQENNPDPLVVVKFFSPYSGATWFATEFDGDDTFFGWCEVLPGMGELGYFSLSELAGLHRGGLPLVERDCHWTLVPLSKATGEAAPYVEGETA